MTSDTLLVPGCAKSLLAIRSVSNRFQSPCYWFGADGMGSFGRSLLVLAHGGVGVIEKVRVMRSVIIASSVSDALEDVLGVPLNMT